MGQIVKQVSPHTTRSYWYPGDKKEYQRGVAAVVIGGLVYAILHLVTHQVLFPAVAGTSITALLAGFNFGRRDSRAIAALAEAAGPSRDREAARLVRRTAVAHSGRAAWRGFAQGTGGAAAVVLIANLSAKGFVADWLLPLIPAVVGACAHQFGMAYERLGHRRTADGRTASERAARPDTPTVAEARLAEARARARKGRVPDHDEVDKLTAGPAAPKRVPPVQTAPVAGAAETRAPDQTTPAKPIGGQPGPPTVS